MDNRKKWITIRIRRGWTFLAAGALVMILGIFNELMYSSLSYDPRIVTALGILFAGIGIGYLVRYRTALKDTRFAKHLIVEEQDERSILIRARAGNRAYLVSLALAFTGLMWVSFAGNRSLPELGGDALWYFLAAVVVIPFVIYVVSTIMDERSS
jgi:hypothetical protein